jgi:hypothetical protein
MLRGVCVFISEFMIKPAASEILGFFRGRSTPYPFPRGVCRSRSWEKSDILFGRAIVRECGGGGDLMLFAGCCEDGGPGGRETQKRGRVDEEQN